MENLTITKNKTSLSDLFARVGSVIRGKERPVRLAIATLLSRGHLLIEDVPGVGKTTLAFTLAKAIDCSFQRIQFTSDMLPSDIIGVSIFNPDTREFEFKPGPLFANIVLADEINRTTPKTQSALLEAMNDRRISVDRSTYVLPEPFMVIATQNPIEYRGTFPLPESQLDRFAMHLKLGYPAREDEKNALLHRMDLEAIERLWHVIEAAEVIRMQDEVEQVRIDDSVLNYLMDIVIATRNHDRIRLGASTRGAQFMLKVSRAYAYTFGRSYVSPGDVKDVAPFVLGHRIILKRQSFLSDAVDVVEEIVAKLHPPV